MEALLNEVVYGITKSPIREFTALAKATPGCIALTLGEPDFDTPLAIEREVERAFQAGETHYIPNAGMPMLRSKIAEFENREHGHKWTERNVLVTSGAEEAVFLALFSILSPGDEVIIPEPAFGVYEQITRLCRAKPVLLDTSADAFQIKREKLAALVTDRTRAIVLNTPNNPTGCLLNAQSLDAVHDLVKGRACFVISDDVYNRLVYTSGVLSIMDYEDLEGQCMLVQSFSKPYAMTGWRMGYLCAPEALIARLTLVHQLIMASTPAPFQRACTRALDLDVSPFVQEYRRRRDFVLDRLSEIGLDVVMPEGAFYVFPSIARYGMDSMTFCRRLLKEQKLAVTPGIAFHADDHIRLSYCASMEELEEGLDRLERFVRSLL